MSSSNPYSIKQLFKKNKYLLSKTIKNVREKDTNFVKDPKYAEYYRSVCQFFKLVQQLEPTFFWKRDFVRVFFLSLLFAKDPENYNIDPQSLFFQSIINHIHALEIYINSSSPPIGWIPCWVQYITHYIEWKRTNLSPPIYTSSFLRNNNIQKTPSPNITKSSPSIKPISPLIKPASNLSSSNTIENTIENIQWEQIRKDMKDSSIQEWNFTWTLLEDTQILFQEISKSLGYSTNKIQSDLDVEYWKKHIINHENKEFAFKNYFSSIHEIFELIGIPDYRNRYLSLNQACNEIITRQSFEEGIPRIFQMIFAECQVLNSNINHYRKQLLKGKKD